MCHPAGAAWLEEADASTAEHPLLAALRAESPAVREAAVYYVGLAGDHRHVEAVGRLVDDEDGRVRREAIRALDFLTLDPCARPAVAHLLFRLLHDGVWTVRGDACRALANAESDDWTELEGCLADSAPFVRLAAAGALARLGAPLHPRDLSTIFAEFANTSAAVLLVPLLDRLQDPAQAEQLRAMQQSLPTAAALRVEWTLERLRGIASGQDADWRTPAQRREDRFHDGVRDGRRVLHAAAWTETDKHEVLDAARSARFVVFGEMHDDGGPLRAAQCELLRAFAGPHPEFATLGFEPSVEAAQQSVIALARQLGMRALPLEQNWQTLIAGQQSAERDDEAARTIRSFFAADPRSRLFVIRGKTHVMPGSYLLQQVPSPDLVVFDDSPPTEIPLHFRGWEPACAGRVFQLGDDGRRYVWSCDDGRDYPGCVVLREWLAQHAAQTSGPHR